MEMRDVLDGNAVLVMERACTLALQGNAVALRLVVERLLPRVGRELPGIMPQLARGSDLVGGIQTVVQAVVSGELGLDEARAFGGLLELERRALETENLRVRIEALEAQDLEGVS